MVSKVKHKSAYLEKVEGYLEENKQIPTNAFISTQVEEEFFGI